MYMEWYVKLLLYLVCYITFAGTELTGPDVILTGSNVIALYYSEYDPATSQVYDGYVRLTEHSFRTLSGNFVY